MKLRLEGHEYRYAVEQILLALFPAERPEYVEAEPDPGENWACVGLETRDGLRAYARIRWEGKSACARQEGDASRLGDKLEADRECQRILKLAFYNAAMQLLPKKPVWGALTGIRPGTIMTGYLESGLGDREAVARMEEEYFVSPERAELCLHTAKASIRTAGELEKRDVALYVGIPFCPSRCAYCTFVSQSVEKSIGLIPGFLEALYREIHQTAQAAGRLGLRPVAVYIGGGTPTTLSAPQLEELIRRLRGEFDLGAVREFCVEAGRPDTITAEKLRAMAGVTRLSINPQSMSDKVLAANGRRHTAEDILRAYELVRGETDCAVNMDLIAGLPADTPEGFERTVEQVTGLAPENITVHTLALKKGSRITENDTTRPDGEAVGQMIDTGNRIITGAGYRPYYLYRQKFMSGGFENVGWSKPGEESLYNILIMEELCTILAMGGGASTKLVNRESGLIQRIFDPKYPKEYMESGEKIAADKEKIIRFYAGM